MPTTQSLTTSHRTIEVSPSRGEVAKVGPASPNTGSPTSLAYQTAGAEIPLAAYKTIALALAWILVVALIAFGRATESAWILTVTIAFSIIVVSLNCILWHTNRALTRAKPRELEDFLHSDVEVATGRLAGWEAYVQIITIPLCLALAATAFGTIWLWVS
jgi:hypothetical protein